MHKEELFNAMTHLVGAIAGLIGLVMLVIFAAHQGDPWKIVSVSIYGTTLFYLYVVSTLYHSLHGKAKQICQMLDHQAIYLLIAGTYTPFMLVTLRGPWGWSIFGVVWGLAVVGIIVDSLPQKGQRILPLVIYLGMGWLIMVALSPLLQVFSLTGFSWLLLGGLLYSFGVIFYVLDKKAYYFHGIWHLFVLAGSTAHYFTVFYYVL